MGNQVQDYAYIMVDVRLTRIDTLHGSCGARDSETSKIQKGEWSQFAE